MHLELEEAVVEQPKTDVVYHNETVKSLKTTTKRIFWPVVILISNKSGRLLVRPVMDKPTAPNQINAPDFSHWIEPTSPRLHPCGYWNCIRKKDELAEFKVYSNLVNYYRDGFDWALYLKNVKPSSRVVVPFDLFSPEQRGDMTESDSIKLPPVEDRLSCDYPANPRFIWSSLKHLSSDDIASVYESNGLIKSSGGVSSDLNTSSSSGVVLLPEKLDLAFIKYPNVNFVSSMSKLNIACVHREYIDLMTGGGNNYLSISFPHLIKCESLNLVETKSKLNLKNVLMTMFTCLDLSKSIVSYLI